MKNVMGLTFFPPRAFLIITFEWVPQEIKRHQNLSCYEHCCWENKSILPNVNRQLVIIMRIECVSLIIYSSCNIKMRAVIHWSLICALSRCTLSLGLAGALPASSRGLCAREAMKGCPEVKLGWLHDSQLWLLYILFRTWPLQRAPTAPYLSVSTFTLVLQCQWLVSLSPLFWKYLQLKSTEHYPRVKGLWLL